MAQRQYRDYRGRRYYDHWDDDMVGGGDDDASARWVMLGMVAAGVAGLGWRWLNRERDQVVQQRRGERAKARQVQRPQSRRVEAPPTTDAVDREWWLDDIHPRRSPAEATATSVGRAPTAGSASQQRRPISSARHRRSSAAQPRMGGQPTAVVRPRPPVAEVPAPLAEAMVTSAAPNASPQARAMLAPIDSHSMPAGVPDIPAPEPVDSPLEAVDLTLEPLDQEEAGPASRTVAQRAPAPPATDRLSDDAAAILLLADVRDTFARDQADRLTSATLTSALTEMPGRPWAAWRDDGRPITSHALSRVLRRFGVRPGMHRFGERIERGYVARDVEDAWQRYGGLV